MRWLFAVFFALAFASPVYAVPTSPMKVAGANDTLLATTAATTIFTYAPKTAGNYRIAIYYRVSTATTNVTLSASWTDGSGAQTLTIVTAQSTPVGSYVVFPVLINSVANSGAISVTATAGTANQVNVSANLTWGGI